MQEMFGTQAFQTPHDINSTILFLLPTNFFPIIGLIGYELEKYLTPFLHKNNRIQSRLRTNHTAARNNTYLHKNELLFVNFAKTRERLHRFG